MSIETGSTAAPDHAVCDCPCTQCVDGHCPSCAASTPVKAHHLKAAPFPELNPTAATLRAALAGTALAHWQAWHDGINGYADVLDADEPTKEAARQVMLARVRAHQGPWVAAWTGAALLDSWTIEDAVRASVDGQDYMVEYLWQWLTDAGIDPETIESAATDGLPDVEDQGTEATQP